VKITECRSQNNNFTTFAEKAIYTSATRSLYACFSWGRRNVFEIKIVDLGHPRKWFLRLTIFPYFSSTFFSNRISHFPKRKIIEMRFAVQTIENFSFQSFSFFTKTYSVQQLPITNYITGRWCCYGALYRPTSYHGLSHGFKNLNWFYLQQKCLRNVNSTLCSLSPFFWLSFSLTFFRAVLENFCETHRDVHFGF